jgi:AcrR family transcriptional regulator
LEAALKLLAEKGVEGVAINEITEAADVGFGSFYNHFESKEAIYAALVDLVFEDFAVALDRAVRDILDPAEVIAMSVRHTLMRAQREPVWGQFLVREGFSARAVQNGLGRRLLRDVQRGIATRRFNTDAWTSFLSVAGTVLGTIAIGLRLTPPQLQLSVTVKELGFSVHGLPERTARTVLQALGIGPAEADRIGHRPLPTLDSQHPT